MGDIISFLIVGLMGLAQVLLLVAIVFALIGYISKKNTEQTKYYEKAAKFLLAYTLFAVVGLGSCFGLILLSG